MTVQVQKAAHAYRCPLGNMNKSRLMSDPSPTPLVISKTNKVTVNQVDQTW
jgi:hypothetical protein